MKELELSKRFALVEHEIATLECYNPSIILEADTLEELEALEVSDYIDVGCTKGFTFVEQTDEGLVDAYSLEKFEMNSYK